MEVEDVDTKKVNLMFKRIGADVPILSKSEGYESDHLPARALALSNRFGYIFFAHSRGFSVAKTADLLEVAEKLDANADDTKTAQEAGTATVTVPNIRSLTLSSDELTVCVCAGDDVMLYELATLVHQSDKRPFEVRKVDPQDDTYAKDFFWSPSKSEAYLILTSQGQLLLGHLGSAPECKVDKGVVAASWSADGQHIAYVADSRQLNITTSNFAKTLQHELPNRLSDEDDDSDDLHVDALRWVRPDSIVIGYLRVNSEGEEDEYPLFVLNSRNGNLVQEDSNLLGLVFYQLFPSIDPFVVPSGSGPYMLSDYVKHWELMVAASRKSIDDHIVLMGWFPEDGKDVLYSLELGNDVWIPRIELQESGEDNAILGLAVDRTTTQIKLFDPTDESGDTMLPPCPVLVCLTLEGKLSFFSFSRLGEKSQVPDLVTAPSNVPDVKRPIPQLSSQLTSQQEDPATVLTPVSSSVDKVAALNIELPKVDLPKVEKPKVEPPKDVFPSPDLTALSKVPHLGENNSKEPLGQSTVKPAVKDERDSLFERLTSASPSFPQRDVGDHPSESSRSGPTLLCEDVKNSMSIPTSPSVITLGDLTGVVNVASKKDYFEGLFRPFDDASKSGLASVKSAPPQVQWGSKLPSISSPLPTTSSVPLQSTQSVPVPTAIPQADSQGKGFQGGPASNPPIAFGQGSQGRGFQVEPVSNPAVSKSQGSQDKGFLGVPAANPAFSLGQGSQGKGLFGGPAANPTVSVGLSSQGKGFQEGPAAKEAISVGPGSEGKGFQGGPATNPTASFGQRSQGKVFQGGPAANPLGSFGQGQGKGFQVAANSAVSFGPGPQGKGFQGGSAANPTISFGPGSQGKDFQAGFGTNPTVSFGTSAKSPLGPTAPKVTPNQRGADSFTHRSRILQEPRSAGRAAGVTDMEAAFNAELEEVREMSEKVDQLMLYIEGRWHGDAHETPVVFTRDSLEELELGIHRLSKECKEFKGQLNQSKEEIEDLRDEEMRVDAWRIYTQSLMDQKNDSRYQELWNSQNLHPELEIKRKRLLKADQALKQHIADLEGHLHILELKQFQQGNTRRRTNKPVQSPGRFLSVQNLYNTVNAQMAVADELSNSLAKQMEALNIKWSPQTPKSTASKILKSVGADTDDREYGQSPLPRTRLSYSPMPNRGTMNGFSAFPAHDNEPSLQETTRRRRDSIDAAWVNRETPKTTIKRTVRTRPSQNVSPIDSTRSKFRQRLQPSSDIPTTEKVLFPQNAQPAQSTRMGSASANQSFVDPSLKESVPSFKLSGLFSSTPQWPPPSQLEAQQAKPGPTFPFGDHRGSSSAMHQGSGSQATTTSTKESMFKWANPTALSKPVASAPRSTVLPTPPTKLFSKDNSDGSDTGVNPRVLQATKPASFVTPGGTGAFNFAQASFSKPTTTAGNLDKPTAAVLGPSKSTSFSKMGTGVGHRLGSLSSGGNDSDHNGDGTSKRNEMTAKAMPLQTGPSPVPISTGAALTLASHFGGPPSTSTMAGPTPFSQISKPTTVTGASKGSSLSGISVAFQSAQSRKAEEAQKRDEESKPPSSKETPLGIQFPSFSKVESTKVPLKIVDTPETRRDSASNEKQVTRVQSDLANLAKPLQANQQGSPSLFSGGNTMRPFDLNSSAVRSAPSTASGSSLSTLSSTTPHISPPLVQTPVSKSVSASTKASPSPSPVTNTSTVKAVTDPPITKGNEAEPETPVKTGSPAAATAFPFTNLGSKVNQGQLKTPGKIGTVATPTPVANAEQPSSPVSKLEVGTPTENKGLSSMSSGDMAVSTVGTLATTTATSSLFSTPKVSTGLFSSSSASSTGSAFGTSTSSVTNQSSGSAFGTSTTSVANQSSGSIFASSTLPAFPTASSQSIPSSPFAESAFGQSTFGQSSPFGQSAQQPIQQPFSFPGSSASSMVSNATTLFSSVESNEEDMEEEASTGNGNGNAALGSFGGFGGLGLGTSASEAQTQKSNPFGVSGFGNSQPFQLAPPSGGQLFRPATFSLPAAQSSPQQATGSTFGSGFGSSGFSQNNLFSESAKGFGSPPLSTGGGFGQPAQLGPGQQALGSALGAFGQTRQVGFGTPFGNSAMGSPAGGGFGNSSPGGGFANAATGGGGFAKAATGGGFAGAPMGGGFAGAAAGGGFAGASAGGGFNNTGGIGGGFGGVAGGGFQAFAGNQGASPGFGSGVQPAQTHLFTQMRK